MIKVEKVCFSPLKDLFLLKVKIIQRNQWNKGQLDIVMSE